MLVIRGCPVSKYVYTVSHCLYNIVRKLSGMFVLDKPRSSTATYIFLHITLADGRLKYAVKEKILPDDWPLLWSGQTPKRLQSVKAVVLHIDAFVRRIVDNAKLNRRSLTVSEMRELLDAELGRRKNDAFGFYHILDDIIKRMITGDITNFAGRKYSAGSIRKMRHGVRVLRAFSPKMTFDNISMDTYHRFIAWCNQRGYSRNYTGAQIVNWKTMLKQAYNKKYHSNQVFERFAKLSEDVDNIALSEQELLQLERVKLTSVTQQAVRDWFLIDCYLGLRINDLLNLTAADIRKNTITIVTQKTDTKVALPVHPVVQCILGRRSGAFPPKLSDVKINKLIKAIAYKAGIKTPVLYTVTEGGEAKTYKAKKYQVISAHTARRTFITNTRKNGIPDSIVMKLTGIRSVKTLQKYDKLKPEEAAGIAAAHPWFKGGEGI